MTQARTHANEVGSPSLPQPWLDALLRLFVELVQNVVATLWMRRSGQTCDWHTDPIVNALPAETTDPTKDPHAVQPDSPIALMLRRPKAVSKHEGVLTTVSHTSPSPSVSHATRAIHLPLLRRWRTRLRGTSSTAFGGGGGSPRLRGETEGARQEHNGSGPKVRIPRLRGEHGG